MLRLRSHTNFLTQAFLTSITTFDLLSTPEGDPLQLRCLSQSSTKVDDSLMTPDVLTSYVVARFIRQAVFVRLGISGALVLMTHEPFV